ncbi:MAG: thiol oxidoreductase [Gemmatimonadetes bacterium]|nr:thiol oxidoreductase [Gemmatimonadota bacterium]
MPMPSRRLSALRFVLVPMLLLACGEPFLPGAIDPTTTLDGPIDGLSATQVATHARGDAEFARRFAAIDGLGPTFVATSCESCHVGDGKGHPLFDITRFGRYAEGLFDRMPAHGGPQLQNRAILGYAAEQLPAGATAIARFTAPAVTGLGYLEALDDATILANADPTDANGDGISGRPSMVDSTDLVIDVISVSDLAAGAEQTRHRPTGGQYVGRFGKKARTINLLHQTVFAYSEDMGITSEHVPQDLYSPHVGSQGGDGVADPEVSAAVVDAVVFYLRTLRPPPRRNAGDAAVQEGEALFTQIGCSACHIPTLRAGRSDIPQISGALFSPYTDLLLHDMGSELDDGYTEGDAAPSEWRTAPLWGIGLVERAQGGGAHYLHDGRATSLPDAIRFHGGEGASSRAAFTALDAAKQARLLAFLRSL